MSRRVALGIPLALGVAAFRTGVVNWWYGLLLRRSAVPVQRVPVEGTSAERS